MSDTTYLAVAFASRTANGHLRPAVAEAAPEGAKVVRTRSDVIAAVFEVDDDVDARSEGERLRRLVAEEADGRVVRLRDVMTRFSMPFGFYAVESEAGR